MLEDSKLIKASNKLLDIAEEDQQRLSSHLSSSTGMPDGSSIMIFTAMIVEAHHAIKENRTRMNSREVLKVTGREKDVLNKSQKTLKRVIDNFDQLNLSTLGAPPDQALKKIQCAHDAVECEWQRLNNGYLPSANSTLFIDFFSDSASFDQDQLVEFLIREDRNFSCSSLVEHTRALSRIHVTDQFAFTRIADPEEALTFGQRHKESLRRSSCIANLLCHRMDELTTALDPENIESTRKQIQAFRNDTHRRLETLPKWLEDA